MLQVATFDVTSVAAAVQMHTTTTMTHGGRELECFKNIQMTFLIPNA